MDSVAVDTSKPSATPEKAQPSPKQHVSPERPMDKRSIAREAKKKQRRRAHRIVLRRSHSDG
jgi:hypothetical protein